jgi:3-dehydroquinate synthase
LDSLGQSLRASGLRGPAALVSDENAGALYASRAVESLREAGFAPHQVLIPPGEQHKTIDTVGLLWEAFLNAGLERGSLVAALGGGVVSDLAGFAAATFLRGVPWAVVPTTLLAMADASLGGKTGADLPQGKNLVGAFHPPRLVLVDPETLRTLPEGELRSGMAEVVKAGVIGDPALFALCAQGWQAVQSDWDEVVRRAMAVKIRVIQADPFEKGQRASLNLGHTLGHALEAASGFRLRHGEAVAIGMVAATRLSERLGLAETGLAEQIRSTLIGLGLPTEIPNGLDRRVILDGMRYDKKRSNSLVRFALPIRIGEIKVGIEVEDLERVLD